MQKGVNYQVVIGPPPPAMDEIPQKLWNVQISQSNFWLRSLQIIINNRLHSTAAQQYAYHQLHSFGVQPKRGSGRFSQGRSKQKPAPIYVLVD